MAKGRAEVDIIINGGDQIEQVSISTEKLADNTLKLTKGIAGSFELAAQAAGVFGEKNAAAFEKTIARATQYIALSNSLKDIAEGFTKENLKGFQSIVQGFGKATGAAKIFGNVSKAALISTGIGAIVVALGLMVAYWDDIVGLMKDSSAELDAQLSKTNALAQANSELASEINREREKQIKILETQEGQEQKILFLKRRILEEDRDSLKVQLQAIQKQKDLLDAVEDLNEEQIEKRKELNTKYEETLGKINDNKRAIEVQGALELKLIRETEQALQEKYAKDAKERKSKADDERKKAEAAAAFSKKISDEIKERELQLIKDEQEREIQLVQFKKNNEAILRDEEFKAGKISYEQLTKFKEILEKELQQEISIINEKARKERVEKEINAEKSFLDERFKLIEDNYKNINDVGDKLVPIGEKIIGEDGSEIQNYATEIDRLGLVIDDINDSLNVLNSDGLSPEGFIEYQNFTEKLKTTLSDLNEELIKSGFEVRKAGDEFESYYEVVKLTGEELANINFTEFIDGKKIEQSYDDALELEKEYVEKVIEERKRAGDESYKQYEEYLSRIKETLGESTVGFSEDTVKALDSAVAYADVAGSLVEAVFSRITFLMQQELNQIQSDLTEVNNQYQEAVNNRESLENELQTATGARREELLNSLEKEKKKEQELAKEREKLRRKEIDVKNEIAKADYANAVIQSTIAAAQAVLKALATTPPASYAFAAISAGLAAVQTAIVIANKPKPIKYASGGYTGDGIGSPDETGHRPAGIVHANEYVVPARVLNSESGSRMVAQLESMRQSGARTFAQGGFTTTPILSDNTGDGALALMSALEGLNLSVAVTEIQQVSNRVNVIEDKSSI